MRKIIATLTAALLLGTGTLAAQAAPSPKAEVVNSTVSTFNVTTGTKAAAKLSNLPKGAKVTSTSWTIGGKKYSSLKYPVLKKTGTLKVTVKYRVGNATKTLTDSRLVKVGPGVGKYSTCTKLKKAKFGPYYKGTPQYSGYRDSDKDGVVCE